MSEDEIRALAEAHANLLTAHPTETDFAAAEAEVRRFLADGARYSKSTGWVWPEPGATVEVRARRALERARYACIQARGDFDVADAFEAVRLYLVPDDDSDEVCRDGKVYGILCDRAVYLLRYLPGGREVPLCLTHTYERMTWAAQDGRPVMTRTRRASG